MLNARFNPQSKQKPRGEGDEKYISGNQSIIKMQVVSDAANICICNLKDPICNRLSEEESTNRN